jgi:hypothetical protein
MKFDVEVVPSDGMPGYYDARVFRVKSDGTRDQESEVVPILRLTPQEAQAKMNSPDANEEKGTLVPKVWREAHDKALAIIASKE